MKTRLPYHQNLLSCSCIFLIVFSSSLLAEPHFYPPLPETPRLQFLKSYQTTSDLGKSESFFARFIFGKKKGEGLGKPYGVGIFKSTVYLCDTLENDVRVMNLEKKTSRWLGRSKGVRFKKPINIEIDSMGRKYIADSELGMILVFDATDNYIKRYVDPDGWKPTDVAIAKDELYVVDIANNQVKVVDKKTGKILRNIGKAGSGAGEVFKPTNIALGLQGDVYISDTINFRIQQFSHDGSFIRTIGQIGRKPGTFSRPKGLVVDPHGRLYVVDAAFENVQIFDEEGQVLLYFGGPGTGPGQMTLPADIAIDPDPENLARFQELADQRLKLEYLLWVTNQYGSRQLSVYGYGRWNENPGTPK